MRPLFPILLFTACASVVCAQEEIRFTNFTTEDGAPDAIITGMAEDHLGRIWFCTLAGLYSFDGYEFEHYTNIPGDSLSLPHNELDELAIVGRDTLLIAGRSGLTLFNMMTGEFKDMTGSKQFSGPPIPQTVNGIYVHDRNTWWLGSNEGLYRVRLDDNAVDKWLVLENPSTRWERAFNIILNLEPDRLDPNIMWLSSIAFPIRLDLRTMEFTPLPQDPGYNSDDVNDMAARYASTYDFKVGTEDEIWMATDGGGLKKVTTKDGSWDVYQVDSDGTVYDNIVVDVEVVDKDKVWVATRSHGVMSFDKTTETFTPFSNNPEYEHSILPRGGSAIKTDGDGRIWLGMQVGISCFDPHTHIFEVHPSNLKNLSYLAWSHYDQTNQTFYTVRASQAFKYDAITDQLVNFQFVDQHGNDIRPAGLSQFEVQQDGSVWFAANSTLMRGTPGIFVAPPSSMVATLKYSSEAGFPLADITFLYTDSRGRTWVGAYYGQPGFIKDGEVQFVAEQECNDALAIVEDARGAIWYGHSHGVVRIESNDTGYMVTNPCIDRKCDDLSLRVYALKEDSQGVMWVGTRHSGLIGIDPNDNNSFEHISIHNGLPSVEVLCLESQDEFIWIGTRSGLARLNIHTNEVNTFTVNDGLFHNMINGLEFNGDSLLFVSTRGGMNVLNLHHMDQFINKEPPRIYFTNFNVSGAPPDETVKGNLREGFTLKYPNNNFSVEYSGVNLTHPEDNTYRYRLQGVNQEWIEAGKRRFTSYNNLDPGHYTLEVLAANNHGFWTEQPTALPIYVKPAFWQTRWFRIGSLIALCLILYGLYRFRISQIRKESQLILEFNKKVVSAESQALRAQMNPHFIFNALNSIKLFVMDRDPSVAGGYLDDFARLVRLVLQNSNETLITLDKELEALELYIKMEKLRFQKEFNYNIQVDPSIETDFFEIPPLLLQPYVENAIWHGFMPLDDNGILTIQIGMEGEKLVIEIDDNGIGRKKSGDLKSTSPTFRKSMGTQITKERMDLQRELSGILINVETIDKYSNSGTSTGTQVRIVVDYSPKPN